MADFSDLITRRTFFQGPAGDTLSLIAEGEPPWTALARLQDFIIDVFTPNLPDRIPILTPLPNPIVLLPDGSVSWDAALVTDASSKGRPVALIGDTLIPDASILCAGAIFADRRIRIGKGVVIEPGAFVRGPTVIGDRTDVRHGAYIRGNCLIGQACVVGHATEVKGSIFLDAAKAGHFAYVGDSILGENVNLGAGTKLANLRFGTGNVIITVGGKRVDTGRRKLGAILGDLVQTGCNSVANPGAILGHSSLVPPNTSVRPGFHPPRSVIR